MLFTTYRPAQRPSVGRFFTDPEVKSAFGRATVMLGDGPFPVAGKVIGWRRTNAGGLGAIVANPVTGRRFLFCLDFVTGRPKVLTRLS
jgi:hypothetical protein